jgi:hypothetical protein
LKVDSHAGSSTDFNHDHTEDSKDNEVAPIPPVGHLGIVAHQLSMHILVLGLDVLNFIPDGMAVVEGCVDDSRGGKGEGN